MDIFSTRPGIAVAVPSYGTPLTLMLEGWSGYEVFKSVITGFSLQTSSGVSFSHNLTDFIDAFTFGERISELSLSGVSFFAACGQEVADPQTGEFMPTYHGFEYVVEYYNTYRASAFGLPVIAAVGLGTIFEGFLTSAAIGTKDADQLLTTFTLGLKVLPQSSILD